MDPSSDRRLPQHPTVLQPQQHALYAVASPHSATSPGPAPEQQRTRLDSHPNTSSRRSSHGSQHQQSQQHLQHAGQPHLVASNAHLHSAAPTLGTGMPTGAGHTMPNDWTTASSSTHTPISALLGHHANANHADHAYHSTLGPSGVIYGEPAGMGASGGVAASLSAPYPGRAASLPGTTHQGSQHGSQSRHRPAQTGAAILNGTSSPLLSAGPGANNVGAPVSPFGANSASMVTSPQLRAQLAQHVANGNLPPSFLNQSSPQSQQYQHQHHHQHTHTHQHQQQHQHQHSHPHQHHNQHSASSGLPYERYTAELTNCIIAFLSPILPTEEEYRMKEATRRQLERLAGRVRPGAKLLAFGSMANGFALRNSDMDLCCLMGRKGPENGSDTEPIPSASELVEQLAKVIREETDFNVLPLPKARIPIIKISRGSTQELPYEISCDIGFENRLALENTRLLLSYAMVDPPRLRTLVLFLKVWTKRRKLNSPYMGTLSSYGYTLLVLYFLCHVKRPAVLPNLQRIPPTRPLNPEEVELNGNNIYFYDDMATLRKEWQSQNTENVAELLIDFFRYFAKDFVYSRDAISLRTETGLIPKDATTWNAELCIEDPFQLGYNVSRTVTKDGLYTIRGEFMRATRILQNRQQRVSAQLAELCEEREDIVARAPDTPPMRNKYIPNANSLHPYVDARTMRDLYYDGHSRRNTNVNPSGFGGSFAFEEMARGLGRQRGQMAYPTAAMLAPLSQNGGLSPRLAARTMRDMTHRAGGAVAGDRQAMQTSSGTSGLGPRHSSTVPSSARSEDGGAAFNSVAANNGEMDGERTRGKRRMVHASARTSPTYAPAVPHGVGDSNAVGEAWAFGSEIVFGSERFRLHPNPTQRTSNLDKKSVRSEAGGARASGREQASLVTRSASASGERANQNQSTGGSPSQGGSRAGAGLGDGVQSQAIRLPPVPPTQNPASLHIKRASRSFSDGVNRSHSLPRGTPYGTRGGVQPSPSSGQSSRMAAELQNSLEGLTLYEPASGRQSPVAGSDTASQAETEVSSTMPPTGEYTAAWAQSQLNHQHDSAGGGDGGGDDADADRTIRRMTGPDPSTMPVGAEVSEGQRPMPSGRRSSISSHSVSDFDGSDDGLSEDILDELSRVSEMETQGDSSPGDLSRSSSYDKLVEFRPRS
ncbi:unnamed protein product [Parajaminaea phylloscopi]